MTHEFMTDPDLNDYEYQQENFLEFDDRFRLYQKARIRNENRDLWDKSWSKPE
jgi:hypothetical protein